MDKYELKDYPEARKTFTVYVEGKVRQVYEIKDLEHWADDSFYKNRWVEMDGSLYPCSEHVPRICWRFEYRQDCSTKIKWDDMSFSKNGNMMIYANDRLVYSFYNSCEFSALAKAATLVYELFNGPNILEPETEIGRQISYFGLPAKIYKFEAGQLMIKADLTVDERYDTLSKWINELHKVSKAIKGFSYGEECYDGIINHGDFLSDSNINWFPKYEVDNVQPLFGQPQVSEEVR